MPHTGLVMQCNAFSLPLPYAVFYWESGNPRLHLVFIVRIQGGLGESAPVSDPRSGGRRAARGDCKLTPWLGVLDSEPTAWLGVACSEPTPWLGVARGRGAERSGAPSQGKASFLPPLAKG